MARREDREEWVQSTTEYHQDWTDRQNVGGSLKWKQGLSLEGNSNVRYKAQVAPRRSRGWFWWLLSFAMIAALWFMLR